MSVIARNKNSKPRLTVKDLARDLGMSVSTVSRAF
ncbi:winged helix-turn-helix transcriptional regulator, partial [Mesorhizobium sp. M7A.F.Ca.CA.004.04.2.1]